MCCCAVDRLYERGEGPAPGAELAGDRDVGHHGAFPAVPKHLSALMEALVALAAADPGCGHFAPTLALLLFRA